MSHRYQVFISYSHKDAGLFDELRTMLAPLKDVDVWHDRRIVPGDRWREEIAAALRSARMAVLLISPDFLVSSFILEHELPALLRAQREEGLIVVPVYLRASLVARTELAEYQGANNPQRPIGNLKERADRDVEYLKVAETLLKRLADADAARAGASASIPGADLAGALDGLANSGATPSLGALDTRASLLAPSVALNLQAGRRPRADFEALFELQTDPAQIARAMYGVEAARLPGTAYLAGVREGDDDFATTLADELKNSERGLLLCGRGGIGKTREVAELAADWCSRGWVLALARGGQADTAMGALTALPHELADSRLLVVVDNLHARSMSSSAVDEPYLDRLGACLVSLRALNVKRLRVLLVARSEPQHCARLGLDPAATAWRGWPVRPVPEFSEDGLARLLRALAAEAGVALDDAQAVSLVRRSDRRPSTVVINVGRARARGLPLSEAQWLPNEGDSWDDAIAALRRRHPAVGHVFEALQLLAEVAVHPRHSSVVRLAAGLSGGKADASAVDALVDAGLLGLRDGVLRQFSDELVPRGLALCGIAGSAHA
jgi:hypothetical protein